jgi:hypothetical protein
LLFLRDCGAERWFSENPTRMYMFI